MIYRTLDIILSITILMFISPILLLSVCLIFLQDFEHPFYVSYRVGKGGSLFPLIKLRTMIINADANAVDTTISGDVRVTKIGKILRETKIDEFPQFINVLYGHMSIVGPRPNVPREVALFNEKEKLLLTEKPGITDIASLAFSNLGKLLAGSTDPNLDYKLLIRPKKTELALIYLERKSVSLYLYLIILTFYQLFNQSGMRRCLASLVKRYHHCSDLENFCRSGERKYL